VGTPPEVRHGDVEAGLAAAEHRIEAVYETPAIERRPARRSA
jgi:xanthine dehydrogenase YagR molybdenum-binding subunit